MEYQTRKITVDIGTVLEQEVEAQEAIGTGLAYNRAHDMYNRPFTITSLSGNITVGGSCRSEREAQLYIEELAKLTDWTADKKTIWRDLYAKFGTKQGIITGSADAMSRSMKTYRAEQQEQDSTLH
jgi:hypothetical protein